MLIIDVRAEVLVYKSSLIICKISDCRLNFTALNGHFILAKVLKKAAMYYVCEYVFI